MLLSHLHRVESLEVEVVNLTHRNQELLVECDKLRQDYASCIGTSASAVLVELTLS